MYSTFVNLSVFIKSIFSLLKNKLGKYTEKYMQV